MALGGPIGGPLLNLAKSLALKDAKKWLDENIGRSANALGPVSEDIEKLTTEVYRYSATIQTAVTTAGLPRSTPTQKATAYTVSLAVTEVQTANQILTHLETIRSRLLSTVAGASGRAQDDSDTAFRSAQEATKNLDYTTRQGNNSGSRNFTLELQRYTSMKVFLIPI